jgi:hypothetical protein
MTVAGQGLDLDALILTQHPHGRRVDGTSLLEAVAWWAGEPHSDAPACVSPLLATLGRGWAAALDDEPRQRLKPLVPKLAGTAGDGGDVRRSLELADFLVRACTPAFLRAAGLLLEAERLERLDAVTGWAAAVAAGPPSGDAATAAHERMDASWAAHVRSSMRAGATDAPKAAHWAVQTTAADAAAEAIRVVAGRVGRGTLAGALAEALSAALAAEPSAAGLDAALGCVRNLALHGVQATALDAIGAAAHAAALSAPPDAAWATLRPTVRQLQESMFGLFQRLCEETT